MPPLKMRSYEKGGKRGRVWVINPSKMIFSAASDRLAPTADPRQGQTSRLQREAVGTPSVLPTPGRGSPVNSARNDELIWLASSLLEDQYVGGHHEEDHRWPVHLARRRRRGARPVAFPVLQRRDGC